MKKAQKEQVLKTLNAKNYSEAKKIALNKHFTHAFDLLKKLINPERKVSVKVYPNQDRIGIFVGKDLLINVFRNEIVSPIINIERLNEAEKRSIQLACVSTLIDLH